MGESNYPGYCLSGRGGFIMSLETVYADVDLSGLVIF